MGSAPSAPAVTDPNTTAADQQNLNTTAGETSQQGSMVNQNNPYGSLSYSQTGTSADGTPIYTSTENLSAAQQGLLNTQQETQQTAGTQASNLLTGANYGAESPTQAIGNATSGLTGQAVQQEENFLQPFFAPQVSQLQTQLENEGTMPNSPAYTQAMNNLLQSQGQTESGFVANIEPQMFQQATSEYQMPAQMAESLAGFAAPANENSNLTQTPGLTVQPANLIGATANAQTAEQQSYQDQLQQYQSMMSGLMGIPTAVLGGLAAGATGGASLGLTGLLGAGGLMGSIGGMPATGAGSPTDAQSNAYALSQGINPYG